MVRLASVALSGLVLFVLSTGVTGQSPRPSGLHPEDMDTTCKPCLDFWRFVNGGWLQKNQIPADKSKWGTFDVLSDANRERTRTVLEAAAADKGAPSASERRKLGDLYASCMDTGAIEAQGLKPLQPEFDRIAAIRSRDDLNAALVAFQMSPHVSMSNVTGSVAGPFRLDSQQDRKIPERVIASIGAGPAIFSLPDRDYYTKDDEKSREIRAAFLDYVTRLLALAGTQADAAQVQAKTVLDFETALAQASLTIAERRDPDKTWNPQDLRSLREMAPNFDWVLLFRQAGIPESVTVNVSEPGLLKKVNEQLTAVPIEDWKTWLHWRVLEIAAPFLDQGIEAEWFRFERGVLQGVKQEPARWETCSITVDQDFGDALGKAWVAKYFPPEAKRRMTALVENLRVAMRDELEQSDWMQPETKKNAIQKLNALQVQIGYPDKWKDYSGVTIRRDAFYANVRAAWTAEQRYELAKIGKPLNRNDWSMTPPTVNAYSSAAQVKVVFPAGILAPPFFDMKADDAVNYGAIGAVIGHEMGHQFDDSGSKYDASGALKNWWTEADRKEFDKRTSCVVEQFNTLDVEGGLHHNGKQVLGEALGDLGGLTTAYRAYRKSLEGKPEPPVMDGYTADQRFFIAFARVWGRKFRDEALRLQINTNNHPVDQFRAIGTLQNMPEFQRAFGCKPGDPMTRPAAQQCRIW